MNQDIKMPHNGWGGARPNSGRKSMKVEHTIVMRETRPGRFEQIAEATDPDLTPLAVMQDNMVFFHTKAREVLATIMALPVADDVDATQLQALQDLADVIKMREMSQQCARDLARYTHPPIAPKAAGDAPGGSKLGAAIEITPTPKAVLEAFERAAKGLPPEPRRKL